MKTNQGKETFTVEEVAKVLDQVRTNYNSESVYKGKDMPVAYIIGEIENELGLS